MRVWGSTPVNEAVALLLVPLAERHRMLCGLSSAPPTFHTRTCVRMRTRHVYPCPRPDPHLSPFATRS